MTSRLVKACAALALWTMTAAAPPQATLPNPQIHLWRIELYSTASGKFVRYSYRVDNKEKYPAELFVAAPGLPPCGKNTNSSRTWVDVFDAEDKRLYGFCAMTKPADLDGIWFALPQGTRPLPGVYIVIHDRLRDIKYRSNLAATRL